MSSQPMMTQIGQTRNPATISSEIVRAILALRVRFDSDTKSTGEAAVAVIEGASSTCVSILGNDDLQKGKAPVRRRPAPAPPSYRVFAQTESAKQGASDASPASCAAARTAMSAAADTIAKPGSPSAPVDGAAGP